MHSRTLQVGSDALTIAAQSPEVLDSGADEVLRGLALVRDTWRDGFATELGTWLYSVESRGSGDWRVQAVRSRARGVPETSQVPAATWSDDVTQALVAHGGQASVLECTGLAREKFRVDDLVLVHVDVVPRGARSPLEVYLHRMRARTPRADGTHDSGWYLGAVEGPAQTDPSKLAYIPALELLDEYELIAPALSLPRGTLVLFDDDGIFEVVDADGVERWPRDA